MAGQKDTLVNMGLHITQADAILGGRVTGDGVL